MSLFFRISGQKLIFFGSGTYHKRDALKARGARFNGADKSWVVDLNDENLALAKSLGAQGAVGMASSVETIEPAPLQQKINLESNLETSGFTVSQLMLEASKAINSAFPNPIWVVGEIQNLSKRGEHIYFEVAEGKESSHTTATMTVKTSLWGSQVSFLERRHGKERLAEIFCDGTKIRLLCRVSVYKDRGQISLTVEDIDPKYSQGLLALQRAELLKKLRSLGLDKKTKT